MKHILFFLVFVFSFLPFVSKACQCPPSELSKRECAKYEVIFRGKVLSVAPCDHKPGVAVFKIQDLYKGDATELFKVSFNCDDECAIGFNVGEEWIIYSKYRQIGNAMMDWCSRSRKFFKNAGEDFYAINYGISYDDEVKFLTDSLGLYRLRKSVPIDGNRNQLPTMKQSVIILICSLVTIILFYYIFNKVVK